MIEADYRTGGVWTGLRGNGVEWVERNRGSASVTPFVQLRDGLIAWLGYQEVWDEEKGRAPFAYRQAGLTVHVGEIRDRVKPQLIRLEWPGLRDWDGSGLGFQSPGAGHPHWQVDLFESLRTAHELLPFEPEPTETVEDFGSAVTVQSLKQRISDLEFEACTLPAQRHGGRIVPPNSGTTISTRRRTTKRGFRDG